MAERRPCPYRDVFSLDNLHKAGVVHGRAFERFIAERVQTGPCKVCMSGFLAAARLIGDLPAARGQGLSDRHERLREIGPTSIELESRLADHRQAFEHQAAFDLGRVIQGYGSRVELAHKLIDT